MKIVCFKITLFVIIFIYFAAWQSTQIKASSTALPNTNPHVPGSLNPDPPAVFQKESPHCESAEKCFNLGKEAEKNGRREEGRFYFGFIIDHYAYAVPWFQRAVYLLAKWDVESKSATGDPVLFKIQSAYPEMGDYVSKLLADYNFNQADYSKAAEAYGNLLVTYPDTVLRPMVLIQRGESLFRLKEYDRAIQTFAAFYRENPRDEKVPDVLNKMLEIYLITGNWGKAAGIFREIQWKFPDTPGSQEAEKKLSGTSLQRTNREKFKLSPLEQFNQGKSLFEIGKFEKAIDSWKEINQKTHRRNPFFAEMELKMGLALLPLKKYSEASDHFKNVLKRAPNSEFGQNALLGLARIAVREENEFELRNDRIKGKLLFPHQEAYYKILYLSGNYYEDHHQEARAQEFYQSIIKGLPQSTIVPDAFWKAGWGAYKKGDYITADKRFSKLLDQYPSSVLQLQALYWKGRTKEKTGQVDEAQVTFKKLCQNFAHSYYCHLAKKRMITTAEDSYFRSSSTDPTPGTGIDPSLQPLQAYQKDDHYLKAKELMSMNLTLEASKELTFLADHYRNKSTQLQIDKELIQAGDFYHAFKNLRSQFPDILDRGKTFELPLLWELAYPGEVINRIIETAKEIKIEPEFVAGIMREESLFDIKATSKSGAMGLMQLMPFTGEWVAQQLGVASFVTEELYDQELNIRFGAYYLDHLNQKFQGNLIYTAASYNAGPESVNKWILNGNYNDLEEFVENIPNRETRFYVKRVIRSYEEFKELNPPRRLITSFHFLTH